MTSGGLSSVGPPGAPRGGGTTSIDDFSKIVQDHWAPVYRFLDCSMGNAHDAEDLTQETFLRAWSRLDSFRPGTNLRAWLLRIAANAALDVHRRRGRVGFVPLDRDPIGAADSPGHGLETAERDALLAAALAQLTEMTRMVFHLRVQEDLSFREIAQAVGTTEQGARWHMHQARTRLMAILAEKP